MGQHKNLSALQIIQSVDRSASLKRQKWLIRVDDDDSSGCDERLFSSPVILCVGARSPPSLTSSYAEADCCWAPPVDVCVCV